jgi:hypothetical protein
MELFAIKCTTCQARLKVRDAAAIGQILACPKCGSMVQVAPPTGWRTPTPEEMAAAAAPAASPAAAAAGRDTVSPGITLNMPAPVFPKAAAQAPATAAPAAASASAAPSAVTAAAPSEPQDGPAPQSSGHDLVRRVVAGVRRQWLLVVCSPIAALAIALLAWIALRPGQPVDEQPPADSVAADTSATPADEALGSSGPQQSIQEPAAELATDEIEPPQEIAAPENAPAETVADVEEAAMPPADAIADEPARQRPAAEDVAKSARVPGAFDRAQPGPQTAQGPNAGASNQEPAAGEIAGATNVATAKPEAAVPAAPARDAREAPARDARDEGPLAQETIPEVDVDARLADPLPGIEFKRISLAGFCDFLSQLSTIPITIDVDALALAGRRVNDLVTIDAQDTTVGAALDTVLAPRGLAYVVRNEQLIVTSQAPSAEGILEVKYDVTDLEAAGFDANRLAVLVTRFVAPRSWQERGGKAGLKASQGELLVEQTPLEQRHTAVFLDKLRLARGLAAKGGLRPDEASLKSRYNRAKANLDKEVTANFSLETPLAEVLSWLGRATGTRILIDEASLAEAGQSGRAPATLVADHQPLHEVLVALLTPLRMTFRVVDEKTVQVFDKQLVPERVEFELYAVSDLLASRLDPKELLAKLREHVDPASWTEDSGIGAMELDEAGKQLLVIQSPAAQIRLENLLSRAKPGNRPRPQ